MYSKVSIQSQLSCREAAQSAIKSVIFNSCSLATISSFIILSFIYWFYCQGQGWKSSADNFIDKILTILTYIAQISYPWQFSLIQFNPLFTVLSFNWSVNWDHSQTNPAKYYFKRFSSFIGEKSWVTLEWTVDRQNVDAVIVW